VAPCKHGDDEHSSISVSQITPEYPETQVHEYVSESIATDVESEQVAAFIHGDDKHSLTSASQLKPV